MSASSLSAYVAIILSVVTAIVAAYRGWRKRLQDAARRPFLAGEAAIEEAQAALSMKDRRLRELEEAEAKTRAKLTTAEATIEEQQRQITKLQSELYKEQTLRRQLEADMDLIKKKLSLGTEF